MQPVPVMHASLILQQNRAPTAITSTQNLQPQP